MIKKKEKNLLELMHLKKLDALLKLRIIVGSIFALSTLAIILVFIVDFIFSAVFMLLSYFMVFVLMIRLFAVKKL